MKLLVTGGAGFIGSSYLRLVADEHDATVIDKLTYAGRRENLPAGTDLSVGAIEDPRCWCARRWWAPTRSSTSRPSRMWTARSPTRRRSRAPTIGTGVLLDAVRELGVSRYLQVSTDEVYGSIETGSFTERSRLAPSSPYAATKAAGDLLVAAHAHTYGLEAVIAAARTTTARASTRRS